MIQFWKNDNLYDIIYKIEKDLEINNIDIITIKIPNWNTILYNYLWLKILRKRFKNKKIVILSDDNKSRSIWKQLWIKYSIQDINKNENTTNTKTKNDILKYNYSFFWYLKYEIKNYKNKILFFLKWWKKINTIKTYYTKHSKEKSSIILFLIMFSISIIILFYTFYFTFNKTYIYISPNTEVITKSKNFTFLYTSSDNLSKFQEKLIKIEKDVSIEREYQNINILKDDSNLASWYVDIYNHLKESIKLKENTRFISKEWFIYENREKIILASAKDNTNGKLDPSITKIKLFSKAKDNNDNFIWTRWNIWIWVKLILPWLSTWKNDTKINELIYAKSSSIFKWWNNNYKYELKEEDIKNEKLKLLTELKEKAEIEIENEIKNLNKVNWVQYELLKIENILQYTNTKIEDISKNKISNNLKDFRIRWNLKVSAFVFNKNSIMNKLKDEINWLAVWDNQKILQIRDDIQILYVLDRNKDDTKIKATIWILAEIQYNFRNTNDNYIQRLKTTLAWLDIETAKNILINERQISNVKIEVRPYFMKNISPIYSSIEFIIKN